MAGKKDSERPISGFSARECPVCGHDKSIVYDTRQDYGRLMRRRRCARCRRRWDTVEMPLALWTGFANATAQMETAKAAIEGIRTSLSDLAALMRTVTDMATIDPEETRPALPQRQKAADNSPSPLPQTAHPNQTTALVRDPRLSHLPAPLPYVERRGKRPPPDQTPGQ